MRSHVYRNVLTWGLMTLAVFLLAAPAIVGAEGEPAGASLLRVPYVVQAVEPVVKHGAGARYAKLLRQVPAPDDQKHYGDYHDYGYWAGTSYAGENDLPLGYWVYITPNWYIFGECQAPQAMTSQYRASHVTGDPSKRPAPQYPRGRRPPDRLGVADARRPARMARTSLRKARQGSRRRRL